VTDSVTVFIVLFFYCFCLSFQIVGKRTCGPMPTYDFMVLSLYPFILLSFYPFIKKLIEVAG